MHPTYGRIGGVGVGGLEIIGFDPTSGEFRCQFFDSQGKHTTHTLSVRGDTWICQGKHARCAGVFTDGGKTLTARHERSEDGEKRTP
jgi:hypothetical protein